jgi:hypothetical protein
MSIINTIIRDYNITTLHVINNHQANILALTEFLKDENEITISLGRFACNTLREIETTYDLDASIKLLSNMMILKFALKNNKSNEFSATEISILFSYYVLIVQIHLGKINKPTERGAYFVYGDEIDEVSYLHIEEIQRRLPATDEHTTTLREILSTYDIENEIIRCIIKNNKIISVMQMSLKVE